MDRVFSFHGDKIAEMLEEGEIYGFCYFVNYRYSSLNSQVRRESPVGMVVKEGFRDWDEKLFSSLGKIFVIRVGVEVSDDMDS